MTSELQNLFNQAVEAQSQGKDVEALALYQNINKNGYTSSALEYNKALLLEKQEDWGHALRALDKAQYLGRNPWMASDKVERIQKLIGSNRAYSIGSLGEITQEISKIIRPTESLYGASLLLGFYFIIRAIGFRHRAYFNCVVVSVLLVILASLSFFSDKTTYLVSDTELRALPLEESTSKFNVGKGSKVIVLRTKAKFTEITRPGDFTGWIPSEALEENKN